MIFLSHGHTAVPETAMNVYSNGSVISASAACGFGGGDYPANPRTGPFRYYFKKSPNASNTESTTAALDRLGDEMIETDEDAPEQNSDISPVFTYFGQFIDHDITANTDREAGLSVIDSAIVEPVERERVESELGNLRFGSLNLDSVYGGGPTQGEFAQRMTEALRWPWDRAKLWVGTDIDAGFGTIDLPKDPGRDLLRLGRVINGDGAPFEESDIINLAPGLREMFMRDGEIRVQRAIIGDARNDENLAVAQFHLAMVRLHNRIVDAAHKFDGPLNDREALFHWARQQVSWIYQWLVVNIYLPTICDPEVVEGVRANGAALYNQLLLRAPTPGSDLMPLPLEFSVSAFRFGHTMVRAKYDWSALFGEKTGPKDPLISRADFKQLFQFTGSAKNPMGLPDGTNAPRLPSHWLVEWDRLIDTDLGKFPHRSARKIDTKLAPRLKELDNEDDGVHSAMRQLARRNLRRGHRLNIPSAQACIAGVNAVTGRDIQTLTPDQLHAGSAGAAIKEGGFTQSTPLWFYVLREAEVVSTGRLGKLGSTLVAETLLGLVMNDPNSYWHQQGTDADNRWQPSDGVKPSGEAVNTMSALMRAALFM